ALETAWSRLADAAGPADLRARLAASPWGDPESDDPRSIRLALRLSWAERMTAAAPSARRWTAGAVSVLLAGERFGSDGGLPGPVRHQAQRLLGAGALEAPSPADMRQRLPAAAR